MFKKIKNQKKDKKNMNVTSRFDKKKNKEKRKSSKILEEFLIKSGYDIKPSELNKKILKINMIITTTLVIITLIYAIIYGASTLNLILMILSILIAIFGILYLLSLLIVFAYLDIKIYQRTAQIEDVLPDFLQLTSANISAGMPIDKALWLAVRPRFGVLAKEIEEIAKSTTAGEDLEVALLNFSKKYDSRILKESVSLLIAGIEAGGEIGVLLDKIATNIQEIKLMRKEIGASVTTYTIFITAASIFAAPLLYALSMELLIVVKNIAGELSLDAASTAASGFSFSLSGDAIKQSDFQLFSFLLLGLTSFFSAGITSIIKKGNIKAGIKNIPIYISVALIIYIISEKLLSYLFAGML
ncbi:type II secretion system F family protein [Candidatus Woesearchaeota archaeon]|nr:type II secretion system F family protein [Candidatus Woesearchaeota archaeon]